MTTVVAVETKRGLIFGSDTQSTLGHTKIRKPGAKFFQQGDFVFGAAGLAEYAEELKATELSALEGDAHMHVTTTLAAELDAVQRRVFEQLGLPEEFRNQAGSSVIIGAAGKLYSYWVGGDGGRPSTNGDGFVGVGSGSDYALGVLAGAPRRDEKTVLRALEASAHHDIYTSGPFHVKTFR